MTEKQMMARYEKERAELMAKRTVLDTRLSALDGVIASLRVCLGEKPPRRTSQATGTKAVILDVLADGKARKLDAIAAEARVEASALRKHLQQLVAAGDVTATGATRSRAYAIG